MSTFNYCDVREIILLFRVILERRNITEVRMIYILYITEVNITE